MDRVSLGYSCGCYTFSKPVSVIFGLRSMYLGTPSHTQSFPVQAVTICWVVHQESVWIGYLWAILVAVIILSPKGYRVCTQGHIQPHNLFQSKPSHIKLGRSPRVSVDRVSLGYSCGCYHTFPKGLQIMYLGTHSATQSFPVQAESH